VTPTGTPAAEIDIDLGLVKTLIENQFPQYAGRRLRPIGSGWDNHMIRLGDDLLVRLPRRTIAAELSTHEHQWLPKLAPRLPIAVPAPIHVGRPHGRYPWPWSIVPWLPGKTADQEAPLPGEAARLAEFLAALHQPAPVDAPSNPVRGVPLASRADAVDERIERLRQKTGLITPRLMAIWRAALNASPGATRQWLHGDLHPLNVIVQQGRITGIIDWGDLTGGDPATDLAALWMLFDASDRDSALAAYGGIDPELEARAKGWAMLFGTVLLDTGLQDHPRHAAVGAQTLRRLAQSP